ncbi:MAG: BspA family leucine-rich repeat surface protein [Bacteroidales bacterium]|nr:BspA family leucine-rich repeat surface protein [Bacteroidales bacterium]
MLLSLASFAQGTKEAYAVLNSGTLTFYYNSSIPSDAYGMNTDINNPGWTVDEATAATITTVKFDASFADYLPKSCAYWFFKCKNLTQIVGIENLKTKDVQYFKAMFSDCPQLQSVDLSGFNTAKAIDISCMFRRTVFKSLDLSMFNTENVKEFSSMFEGCSTLQSVDLSSFNTKSATSFRCMFIRCSALTTLDLSGFDTQSSPVTAQMFQYCSSLKTIYVGDSWSNATITETGQMFYACSNLVGGKGSAFASLGDSKTYARIDGGSENPGYFTKSGEPAYTPPVPYVVVNDGTLTFYYNNKKPSEAYELNDTENKPAWESSAESITKVVFDESFAEYKPTSCYCWFNGFKNLTEIVDIKNLKTDAVISFKGMFQDCSSLQSVDVSGFNTAKATDLSCMFRRAAIKTLDLSNFVTDKVTDFDSMFEGCSSLEKLDVHSFDTKSATSFWCMFIDCSNLKELDLSGFDTKNNPRTGHMFQGCSNLITIFVGDSWANGTISDAELMFYDCEKLVGGKGTTVTYIDDSYARIDGGSENPGYFTKSGDKPYEPNKPYVIIKDGKATFYTGTTIPEGAKPIRTSSDDSNWPVSFCRTITNVVFDKSFKEYKPFKTSSWFRDCDNLTEVSGMENINTEELEYMDEMFQFCNNLKYVDFTGFNTAKVTDMTRVFWGCENLAYVLVDENWNTTSVTKSAGMFEDCFKLYGGKGTAYNADITDATYARIDGGTETPGYFTKSGDKPYSPNTAYVVISNGTLTFYYNETKPEGAFSLNTDNNVPDWNTLAESVTKVVFDESFANYFPSSCAYWFNGCKNLTEFEGMKNLNTSQATTLKAMFQDCESLKSVDLSNFKTNKVTDMSCMFRRCYKLPTIDFSSFNVENTIDFSSMFEYASGLQSLNLQSFKTNSEADLLLRCMFIDCFNLTTLDISGFNTKSVTNMEYLFARCNELGTIFVGDNWSTESVTASGRMFESCYNLVGGKGTDFSSNNITAAFARIDGGTENPGYFTKSGEPEYERIVESVEVTTLPKLEYVEGEEFDVENGVINVAFNVGSTKKINLSEATITGYDKTKVGEQTVTVAYKGFETTLTVTVAPKQSTPVSDVANSQDNVNVWSFNSTIYIETAPDTKYTIIDLNGRILKSSTTKSSRDEIRLNQSGIVVVVVNGASYKLAL